MQNTIARKKVATMDKEYTCYIKSLRSQPHNMQKLCKRIEEMKEMNIKFKIEWLQYWVVLYICDKISFREFNHLLNMKA